ncbi:MAG TPA: glycoside hydrolase family 9 protein, partial [Paludibacter sp.]|nr:glycoside hydrolase family 9 protein [Paludibacter sp.]
MRKRIILLLLSIFCISMLTYGVDAWIRINQLGYLPNAQKKAILISESSQQINQFSIHDALTNEELGLFNSVTNKGEFQSFKSTYILDFSDFHIQGAFYIKAGLIYSPTIFINKNVYLGTADFLLNYIRQQRCGFNSTADELTYLSTGYETVGEEQKQTTLKSSEEKPVTNKDDAAKNSAKKTKLSKKTDETPESVKPKFVDVKGGWVEGSDNVQFGATSASSIYQMLFAYQMNPTSFTDRYDAAGKPAINGIPDILDEAKWGLDWLLKMYPDKEILYHQIAAEDHDNNSFRLLAENKTDNASSDIRSVFLATGKAQGLSDNKNHSTGIASIAGKYSSAFGLGAEILSKFNPNYADTLKSKALEVYQYGKKYLGVCQSIGKSEGSYDEDNWTDDMELAAGQLYRLTYEGNYLKEAADFGRMEPVTPWMCSDTARHYQWFPFINLGHYMLANVENPRYQKEFGQNLLNGIQRMSLYAGNNPFNVGIPFIRCSNNLVVALATQCRL